jgi:Putative ER transporter, 6TM, N-terminal
MPQARFGVILFSISVIVPCCNAPLFPNFTYGKTFVKSLLQSELIGLGVATGVSLLIYPVSCRTAIMKQFTRYLEGLQQCLKAYKVLLQSLEDQEAMSDLLTVGRKSRPEASAVTVSINTLNALHGQLQTELPFAKREIAYGKISPDHFKDLNRLMRFVLLPLVGLGSVIDILQQLAAHKGWTKDRIESLNEDEKADRVRLTQEWLWNMKLVHKRFEEITGVMIEAIEHVLLQLQFKTPPKSTKPGTNSGTTTIDNDVESMAERTAPGDPGFASYLARKSNEFRLGKQPSIAEWARKKGMSPPDNGLGHSDVPTDPNSEGFRKDGDDRYHQNQRQLFLMLYVCIPVPQFHPSSFKILLYHLRFVGSGPGAT